MYKRQTLCMATPLLLETVFNGEEITIILRHKIYKFYLTLCDIFPSPEGQHYKEHILTTLISGVIWQQLRSDSTKLVPKLLSSVQQMVVLVYASYGDHSDITVDRILLQEIYEYTLLVNLAYYRSLNRIQIHLFFSQ